MKTVLIYVLSSADQPYPMLLDAANRTWNSHPLEGTETLFYSAKQPASHPNLIQFDCPETLYDMGRKNLLAYQWALSNRKWDYLARVNASCYVVKKKVLERCQTLPHLGVAQGVGAPRADGTGLYLWGGLQYIISRDVIQGLVTHAAEWNHSEMEDMAMSRVLEKMGVPFDLNGQVCSINRQTHNWLCISYDNGLTGGFEFKDFSEFAAKNTSQFIRVKQTDDRKKDVWVMEQLHQNGV